MAHHANLNMFQDGTCVRKAHHHHANQEPVLERHTTHAQSQDLILQNLRMNADALHRLTIDCNAIVTYIYFLGSHFTLSGLVRIFD